MNEMKVLPIYEEAARLGYLVWADSKSSYKTAKAITDYIWAVVNSRARKRVLFLTIPRFWAIKCYFENRDTSGQAGQAGEGG